MKDKKLKLSKQELFEKGDEKQIENLSAFSTSYLSVIQEAFECAQNIEKSVSELLRPQIIFFQKWVEQHKSVFENFRNLGLDRNKKEFLFQNGWVLSPYLSGKKIKGELNSDSILKKKNSEINTIYENFFSENNYSELESMIKSWKKKAISRKELIFSKTD